LSKNSIAYSFEKQSWLDISGMMRQVLLPVLLALLNTASGFNFPFEAIQLTSTDIGNFTSISFGDPKAPITNTASCRSFPGTPSWPLPSEWSQLNISLSGALLHPSPLGSVCYAGPLQNIDACQNLVVNASTSRAYLDDPLTVLTTWPEGETCDVTLNPVGNCTQGGFSVYVVNVTTVRDIQVAVNFARNSNLRLVIKLVIQG
jgi:hypothetical protein